MRIVHFGHACVLLETAGERQRAPRLLAILGGVSSKWYLVLSPLLFVGAALLYVDQSARVQ